MQLRKSAQFDGRNPPTRVALRSLLSRGRSSSLEANLNRLQGTTLNNQSGVDLDLLRLEPRAQFSLAPHGYWTP
jgi:hypothetical protein